MLSPRVKERLTATMAWNAAIIAHGASSVATSAARVWTGSQPVWSWGWPRPELVDDTTPLGRLGSLEVRLAARRKEVRRAQRVRYDVFYEEGGAVPDAVTAGLRRDICRFDAVCDHLIVIDLAKSKRKMGRLKPKVVGTYRLLRQEVAARGFGFYTAQEFEIGPLLARHADKHFLELGRSCVLPDYRSKRTIELLWRGIWAYVQRHDIDVLIGCASLPGTDPAALALPLSYLAHYACAEEAWQAAPLAQRGFPITPLPREAIEEKRALGALPPLMKGYLRAGARFGSGVVVDHAFRTTDVLAVLPLSALDRRYLARFGT